MKENFVEQAADIADAHWNLLEKEMVDELRPIIMLAESKRLGQDRGCYCASCCRRAVENANDAIWEIASYNPDLKESERLLDKYSYVVVPNGLQSSVMRKDEMDEKQRLDKWLRDRQKPDGLYGRIL